MPEADEISPSSAASVTDDAIPRTGARLYFQVFVVSVFILYLEMLLIRWVSTEIRIFAYFKNLTLIACFLGAGLGYSKVFIMCATAAMIGLVIYGAMYFWLRRAIPALARAS